MANDDESASRDAVSILRISLSREMLVVKAGVRHRLVILALATFFVDSFLFSFFFVAGPLLRVVEG